MVIREPDILSDYGFHDDRGIAYLSDGITTN
jgi:hypothetical protein